MRAFFRKKRPCFALPASLFQKNKNILLLLKSDEKTKKNNMLWFFRYSPFFKEERRITKKPLGGLKTSQLFFCERNFEFYLLRFSLFFKKSFFSRILSPISFFALPKNQSYLSLFPRFFLTSNWTHSFPPLGKRMGPIRGQKKTREKGQVKMLSLLGRG